MQTLEVDSNLEKNLKNDTLTPEIIEEKSDRLRRIKSRIEKMDKNNQISALFMITKNKMMIIIPQNPRNVALAESSYFLFFFMLE